MERHFDEELDTLKKNLLTMASLTEQAIDGAIEALKMLNIDKEAAQRRAEEVIAADQRIDELENTIEEHVIEMLALFQPMAKDLRFLTMALRIDTELERIADLVVNICQRVQELTEFDKPLLKPLIDIPRLTDIAKSMVKDAIDAFIHQDETLARSVILRDKEANNVRNQIVRELIDEYMTRDGHCVPRAVPLLLVARDLERISDHASAIAEDVIFLIQARIVKHHPERL